MFLSFLAFPVFILGVSLLTLLFDQALLFSCISVLSLALSPQAYSAMTSFRFRSSAPSR